MKHFRFPVVMALVVFAAARSCLQASEPKSAGAPEIAGGSRAVLDQLYRRDSKVKALGAQAIATLVFPKIIHGGSPIAAWHGDGALFGPHRALGYYRSIAASGGPESGAPPFGYALFFVNKDALSLLVRQGGWDLGSVPGLTVLNQRSIDALDPAQLRGNIYAVFFSQKGVITGLSEKGTKIIRIYPK